MRVKIPYDLTYVVINSVSHVIGGKAQCMQTIHYSSRSDASSKADPGEGLLCIIAVVQK